MGEEEYCAKCGKYTGMVEDRASLYCDKCRAGPYCDDCMDSDGCPMCKGTKLRSIPVERGGRYLIIMELSRPIPMCEVERIEISVKTLNHWLTEEDTPFRAIVCVPGVELRFERVRAATDETQHEAD